MKSFCDDHTPKTLKKDGKGNNSKMRGYRSTRSDEERIEGVATTMVYEAARGLLCGGW